MNSLVSGRILGPEATARLLNLTGDAAKYAMIVSVIRELAAIFDDTNTSNGQEGVSSEHLALVNEALNKAVKKLERAIRRTLK